LYFACKGTKFFLHNTQSDKIIFLKTKPGTRRAKRRTRKIKRRTRGLPSPHAEIAIAARGVFIPLYLVENQRLLY